MLNLGFSEIFLILVVALVVIGPDRLPEVLRFIGKQYGKLTRASNELRRAFMLEAERSDIEKRAEALRQRREEARKRIAEQRERARQAAEDVGTEPELAPVGRTSSPFSPPVPEPPAAPTQTEPAEPASGEEP